MNQTIENYFSNGCERCPLGGTPDCKVHAFHMELMYLRELLVQTELDEACKWGVPCYTYRNKNVVSISAFKKYCAISFFKGVLLDDPSGLLSKPGPRTQSARLLKFHSLTEIKKVELHILDFINQAIENERLGKQVQFSTDLEPYPAELKDIFEHDAGFEMAFESLTPGRKRGYLIYFTQAKQAKTRYDRINKSIPKIMNGIGLHDHYGKRK